MGGVVIAESASIHNIIVSAPDPRFLWLSGYAIKPDCHVIWFADCHVLLHVCSNVALAGSSRCHMIFVRRRSAGVLIGLPEVNICRVSTTKKVREGMGPAPGETSLHPDVLLCACVKMHRFPRATIYKTAQ